MYFKILMMINMECFQKSVKVELLEGNNRIRKLFSTVASAFGELKVQ
jgi:hypothetical protein